MRVVVGLGNPGREYVNTRHNLGWLALDALAERIGAGSFKREKTVLVAEAFHAGEKVYLLKPQTFMNLSGSALASWLGTYREIRDALRLDGAAREEAKKESGEKSASAGKDEAGKGGAGRGGNGQSEVGKREEAKRGAPAVGKADLADDQECVWPGLLILADDVHLPLGRMRFRPTGSAGGHNGLSDLEKALGGKGYPRLRLGIGEPPARMDRVDYVLGQFPKAEESLVQAVTYAAGQASAYWLENGLPAARAKYNGLSVAG